MTWNEDMSAAPNDGETIFQIALTAEHREDYLIASFIESVTRKDGITTLHYPGRSEHGTPVTPACWRPVPA